MLLTCVRAVRSLMTSSAAISLFALPWATKAEDLSLPLRQKVLRARCCAAPQRCRELAGDGRVQMDLAALSRPDRRRDLIGLGVLEQVTGRAGLKRCVDLLLLHEARHRHDLDIRIALLHRGGRLDAVHRLHHQVHQHHVGETALRLRTRQIVQSRSAVSSPRPPSRCRPPAPDSSAAPLAPRGDRRRPGPGSAPTLPWANHARWAGPLRHPSQPHARRMTVARHVLRPMCGASAGWSMPPSTNPLRKGRHHVHRHLLHRPRPLRRRRAPR